MAFAIFSPGAVPPWLGQFLTVARLSLWLVGLDSFLESARSDSRFRRDWRQESCPLWPWSVAHLFIWDDKYFDQPLPQLAIDWEDSSADAYFFLERTPAHRGTRFTSATVIAWMETKNGKGQPLRLALPR